MMRRVGLGTRVLNFLVDTILIFAISYGLYKWWTFYVMYWNREYIPFYVFFWCFLVVYYIFFESIFKRTPGKWLSISKVVTNKGKKPSFLQIVIRSIVRVTIIDCFFIPFLDKPLHDYLSKTEVVEA
ncbi:MAG: RDD family protein [Ilyomonas sp.]